MTSSDETVAPEHRFQRLQRLSPRLVELLWYGAAFSIVAALGLVNLYYPFGPDQANVFLGAQMMSQGEVLYVDYWDNKQPGLYVFYYLAGTLFGFSESGVHLLELLWLLSFSAVLMWTLRQSFRHAYLSALVPIASVGVYYAAAGEYELTQLEFLVSFPIFLSIWLASRNSRGAGATAIAFAASGVLAGVSVVFKLALAPVFVVTWAIVLFDQLWNRKLRFVDVLVQAWLPALLGLALLLGATVYAFWRKGALDSLLWTAFVYPSEVFSTSHPAGRSRIVIAAGYYGSYYAPWLLFVLIGVFDWWRNKQLLTTLIIAWLIVAVILFLVQRFSWWQYHALLLFTPSGILAVLGIDRAVDYLTRTESRTSIRRLAVVALVSIPLVASLTVPFINKARPLLGQLLVYGTGIRGYQFKVSEHYRRLWKTTRFLRRESAPPGEFFAFDHPFAYVFSERDLAHTTTGFSWEWFVPAQTQALLEHLERQRTAYILVGPFNEKLFFLRPQIADYLESRYELFRRDGTGRWYKRREP